MSQEYTPVEWVDETPTQQGTTINKARLDQMQSAHHYADGFEEVDSIPTEDPGVGYHKIVYCTADRTIYRWDGSEWTKDIDDATKALLDAHIADRSNPHQVTKAQVGLGNADNTSDASKPVSTAQAAAIKVVQDALDAHTADYNNPHSVTKAQVGLGNCDNTSDEDKPVSTAQASAIGTVNSTLTAHKDDTANPHSVTKAQVGLGNVDNTSDADKPVSTAQATALAGKVDNTDIVSVWQGIPDNDHIPSEKLTKDSLDAIAGDVSAIDEKIPSAASSSNQLADKNFVNSSIATNTADFLGTFDAEDDLGFTSAQVDAFTDPPNNTVKADVASAIATKLSALSVTPTNNDYVFVSVDKSTTTAPDWYWRFKYDGSAWVYEYTLNNSSFTADQWAAINSMITSGLVTTYSNHVASTGNPHSVTASQVGLGSVVNKGMDNTPTASSDNYVKSGGVASALAEKVDKVTHTSGTYLYANDTGQTQVAVSQGASAYNVVRRDGNSQITVVETPTATNHATSKKYVDDADATKVGNSQIVTAWQGTPDNTHIPSEKLVKDGLDEKLGGFVIPFAGNWTGGVHPVNCVTVDYSTCNSENGVFIKFTMACSHGNGEAYRYLEDVILNVKYTGVVAGTLYRYFAEEIPASQGAPYAGMYYGDLFWTIDTTNKIVKFYVLMGPYSYSRMTPYFRLNMSTGGIITQHNGRGQAEYSSGTQTWATFGDLGILKAGATRPSYNGNNLALYSDLAGKQDALISGSNIKTLNNNSLLGSGNITIDSGEVWEELDPTNLPTDFVEGDRLKIVFKFLSQPSGGALPSSWTTAPAASYSITPFDTTNKTMEVSEVYVGAGISMPIDISTQKNNNNDGCVCVFSYVLEKYTNLNSGTFLHIWFVVFNGAGLSRTIIDVTRTNISTYVKKIWRLKQ